MGIVVLYAGSGAAEFTAVMDCIFEAPLFTGEITTPTCEIEASFVSTLFEGTLGTWPIEGTSITGDLFSISASLDCGAVIDVTDMPLMVADMTAHGETRAVISASFLELGCSMYTGSSISTSILPISGEITLIHKVQGNIVTTFPLIECSITTYVENSATLNCSLDNIFSGTISTVHSTESTLGGSLFHNSALGLPTVFAGSLWAHNEITASIQAQLPDTSCSMSVIIPPIGSISGDIISLSGYAHLTKPSTDTVLRHSKYAVN